MGLMAWFRQKKEPVVETPVEKKDECLYINITKEQVAVCDKFYQDSGNIFLKNHYPEMEIALNRGGGYGRMYLYYKGELLFSITIDDMNEHDQWCYELHAHSEMKDASLFFKAMAEHAAEQDEIHRQKDAKRKEAIDEFKKITEESKYKY
jgi:hypothetical protein